MLVAQRRVLRVPHAAGRRVAVAQQDDRAGAARLVVDLDAVETGSRHRARVCQNRAMHTIGWPGSWRWGWRWVTGLMLLAVPAGAAAQDLTELSASEAAARIRAGTLKSEDLVRALIDVIERKRDLNAFITFDRDRAIASAHKADTLAARKSFAGPLHGVPIVVKDNIHVAGLPNSAGTPALRDFVPTRNAPVAEKLIRAGAIVLGKTNMHELAFGVTSNNAAFGPARNAYDPSRIAGGSSGGTANAIAARMAAAGLGSDTGGSVRIPAALNGIAGLRPTLGRYSQEGITPIAHTRDTAGPMAREVVDLVLLDTIITGARDRVAALPLKGLRLGVCRAALLPEPRLRDRAAHRGDARPAPGRGGRRSSRSRCRASSSSTARSASRSPSTRPAWT